jgi:hypothetical protein
MCVLYACEHFFAQTAEELRKSIEIKATLAPPRAAPARLEPLDTGRRRVLTDAFEGMGGAGSQAGSPPRGAAGGGGGSTAHFAASRRGVAAGGSNTISPTGSRSGPASVYGGGAGLPPPRVGAGARGSVAGSVYSAQPPGSARGAHDRRHVAGGAYGSVGPTSTHAGGVGVGSGPLRSASTHAGGVGVGSGPLRSGPRPGGPPVASKQ